MQHIQIKLFAGADASIEISDAIPVFHRWIQNATLPGMFIDVADYSHVPSGPGVLLIGHEANVSLDETGGRLGLLYNRKAALSGDPGQNLSTVYLAAVQAASLLESEPEFHGKLTFNKDNLQIILNDRLLYPNTEETWNRFADDLNAFASSVVSASNELTREPDPRERFAVTARPR